MPAKAKGKEKEEEKPSGNEANALLIAVAAWLVPGLGHLLLRRWGRAFAFFLTVGGMAVSGYYLRGFVFSSHSNDVFGLLGYLADLGSGLFYFVSKFFETSGPNVALAAGDYGTRFIATAGVLNLLCVLDAYELSRWRKE